MKFKISRVHVFAVVASCVWLTSCVTVKDSEDKKVKPDVYIQVANGQATFVTKGNRRCKSGNRDKNGCLVFERGETGEISFKKQGSGGWWFTALQICKLNPDDTQTCALNEKDRLEFAATDTSKNQLLVPDAMGNVNLRQLSNSLNEFILIDQNSFPQDYYYKIELCRSTSNCEWADPPMENKGRK